MLTHMLQNSLDLYLAAAPWLLLGIVAAGLLKLCVNEARLSGWMGTASFGSILKATLIGMPLPLCSCSVIPTALGLYRNGASRPATIAFLISSPETGVDSFSLSYAMLGLFMAILRPVAALLTAVTAGVLTRMATDAEPRQIATVPAAPSAETTKSACCHAKAAATSRFGAAMQATLKIMDDIFPWLFVGLVIAGVLQTFLPPHALTSLGGGFSAKLIMLAVGIPFYICATGSTPLAAALLAAGISPGTVLVLLLTGPATNVAAMGIIGKEFGRATLMVYLLTLSGMSLGLGVLTDLVVTHFQIPLTITLSHSHPSLFSDVLVYGSAAFLLLCLRPMRRLLTR